MFDSYAQRMVAYPDDFGGPIRFPDGFTLSVALEEDGAHADGGPGQGFRSIGRVAWQLERDGEIVEAADGHAVYRDERPPLAGDYGAVRLMCEILDYRYARYASDADQMIHPFIHRGAWRDVQVWLPAIEYEQGTDGGAPARRATTVPAGPQGLPADELALGRARADARGRRLAARGAALRAEETAVAQPGERGLDLAGAVKRGRRLDDRARLHGAQQRHQRHAVDVKTPRGWSAVTITSRATTKPSSITGLVPICGAPAEGEDAPADRPASRAARARTAPRASAPRAR